VQYIVENPAIEYQEVAFHVVGAPDEPPATIQVDHPK